MGEGAPEKARPWGGLLLALLALACTRQNPAFVTPVPGLDAAQPESRDSAIPPADTLAVESGLLEAPTDVSSEVGPEALPEIPMDGRELDLAADGLAPDAAADLPGEAAPVDSALADLAPDAFAGVGCPPDPALVMCLRFEGQVADRSPNQLTTSALGVDFAPGLDGTAGIFTRSTRVEVAPNPVLDVDAVTIEAWIKPSALPTGTARMGIVDYTREYALFLHPGGDIQCTAVTESDGDRSLRYAAGVQVGVWTHVGCLMGNDKLGILVSGRERASLSMDDLDPSGDTDTLVVGGNYSTTAPDPFEGALDNVRLWREVRAVAAICADAGPLCKLLD